MLSEADLVKYVPEVDDNRDQPQESQWTVDFYPMTAAEQRRYLLAASDSKGSSLKAKKASETLRQIFKDRVVEVHNLVDIRGREITNGVELYENSETDYIDEIWEALTKASTLKRGIVKN